MDGAGMHRLGLTDIIFEGGRGSDKMVPEGNRHLKGGAEREIQGLGNPDGGGVKPRTASLSRNGSRRVPVESWAERGSGQLQSEQRICHIPLQGGWRTRDGASPTMGSHGSGTGCEALATGILFIRGGDPLYHCLGPTPITTDRVLG